MLSETGGGGGGEGQGGRGGGNTEKYCWLPWLADKKNFQILDTRMVKTIIF